jgi:hypothetical protein
VSNPTTPKHNAEILRDGAEHWGNPTSDEFENMPEPKAKQMAKILSRFLKLKPKPKQRGAL